MHDLDLERVGVLELVDHDDRPGIVQATTHRRLVTQQVSRKHEQVMEVQGALGTATPCLDEHPVLHLGGQRLGHCRPDVADEHQTCVLCVSQGIDDIGPVSYTHLTL